MCEKLLGVAETRLGGGREAAVKDAPSILKVQYIQTEISMY